jgi:hypothetical protein
MIESQHLEDGQLSSLIDGRLEADERAQADRHLAGCDRCRSALAGLQATVQLLRGLPELVPPRSFLLAEAVRPPLLLRLAPWTRAAGALAAAVFVILVSADILGAMGSSNATQRQAAPVAAMATAPARATAAAPTAAAKPAAAVKPAAPAAAPAPAAQNQERAADSAKAAGAPPRPTPAAAPAASPAAQPAAARPAASPAAAAPPRPAEPSGAPESSSVGRPTAPSEPGYLAAAPTSLPTITPAPTALPTPAPAASGGVASESALRPWQLASGLLAAVLLLASLLLPRLARRPSPVRRD